MVSRVIASDIAQPSDWLQYEVDDIARPSRNNVVVAPNQTLRSGQVIGATADGTMVVAYDDTGTDGGTATGIIVEDITTGDDPEPAAAIVRLARVAPDSLRWAPGTSDAAKAAALADLRALTIEFVRSV